MPFIQDKDQTQLKRQQNIEAKEKLKQRLMGEKTNIDDVQSTLASFYKPLLQETRNVQDAVIQSSSQLQTQQREFLENIVNQQQDPTAGKYPAIPMPSSRTLGPLAQEFLSIRGDNYDKRFGLQYDSKTNTYSIGVYSVDFDGDDIIIQGRKVPGTRGLWELLMSKSPESKNGYFKNITDRDVQIYNKIVLGSKVYIDPYSQKVLSNKGLKWTKFIGPAYKAMMEQRAIELNKSKDGGTNTFLPNDVEVLVEKLYDLLSNKQAGHTLDYNEVNVICDQLLKMKKINALLFKNILKYISE